jgi:hypothetical protein
VESWRSVYRQIRQDEAEQWRFASGLIDAIPSFDTVYFLKFMALPLHPPLRYFLSIPGILVFPHSGLLTGSMVILAISIAVWNHQILLKPYGSDDPKYPGWLMAAGKATGRMQNIRDRRSDRCRHRSLAGWREILRA